MKVKLDEHMARSHQAFLRQKGYDVDHVYDEGLSGQPDDRVWARACAEGRFFVTLDLGFSDVRRFPPGTHPGILLLRPHRRGRQAVLDVPVRVTQEQPLETLQGCLVAADENHTRIRRPPAVEETDPV